MRSSNIIVALLLGANAWAQSIPPKSPVQPAVQTKPSPVTPAKPVPVATVKPAASAPQKPSAVQAPAPQTVKSAAATAPAKPAVANASAKPVTPAAVKSAAPAAKPVIPAAKPAATKTALPRAAKPSAVKSKAEKSTAQPISKPESAPPAKTKALVIKGQRDPFVSPVVERLGATPCTGTGRKCLAVGEVVLRGIVRSNNEFIAVVMNGDRTYFLREHDPLANGAVERITRDTIVMREHSSDALGHTFTREVTKKLGVPAV